MMDSNLLPRWLRRRCRLCPDGRIAWMKLAYRPGEVKGCDRCWKKVSDGA